MLGIKCEFAGQLSFTIKTVLWGRPKDETEVKGPGDFLQLHKTTNEAASEPGSEKTESDRI
jgi:hypothetical protein